MFFESIEQAFKYIVECFRMVLEEPKLLLPSLSFVLSVLAAIGLYALFSVASPLLGIAVAVVFAFTAISFVSTINQFVRISYYTLIYAWAEERLEHGGPSVAAPAPLKNAFGI
jgi:hypothetical protein